MILAAETELRFENIQAPCCFGLFSTYAGSPDFAKNCAELEPVKILPAEKRRKGEPPAHASKTGDRGLAYDCVLALGRICKVSSTDQVPSAADYDMSSLVDSLRTLATNVYNPVAAKSPDI